MAKRTKPQASTKKKSAKAKKLPKAANIKGTFKKSGATYFLNSEVITDTSAIQDPDQYVNKAVRVFGEFKRKKGPFNSYSWYLKAITIV